MGSVARRAVGGLLILLVTIPFYRLLDSSQTGLAGRSTVALSDLNAAVLWYGALIALIPAVVLARVLEPRLVDHWIDRLRDRLVAPRTPYFASILALLTGSATLCFSLFVLVGKPNLIDAMSQLLHARYLAAGKLAGPVVPESAFWHIQNTVITEKGWVSQYPPGHVVLLALGFRLGAVWMIGPLMAAAAVFMTALAAERLLAEARATARVGAILTACSPFLIGLAGAYMNHITAAAFGATAIYCAVRARDGRLGWAVPTGAALAWVFGTRPLAGVVVGAVVAFTIWLGGAGGRWEQIQRWLARVGCATVGALPLLLLLGAYNHYFFGKPWRFGYSAALGPATSLGFHQDPWGNWYGPLQALGYTSSDLVALNLNLLESPVPVVLIAGLFLALARQLTPGERVIAAWALLPVLGNFFYWHHGLFMGPRMLNEAAPGWALLTAVAGVGIVRRVPAGLRAVGHRYSIKVAVSAFLAAGALGAMVLAPHRLISYGGQWMASARTRVPEVVEPSIVFVHGGWIGRVGSQLAASGMRLDSLETALRQNPLCQVAEYLEALEAKRRGEPIVEQVQLDFVPRSDGSPPRVEISPDNWILVSEDTPLTAECVREVEADRYGVIDVTPLVWQGDLPGSPTPRGPLYVRDLGPELNERLISAFPERIPLFFYQPAPDRAPILVPYAEGRDTLWSNRPTDTGSGRVELTGVP